MDVMEGLQWVETNKMKILRFASKYIDLAPYEECDYLQMANEAAIKACFWEQSKREEELVNGRVVYNFYGAFWRLFREMILKCVAIPQASDESEWENELKKANGDKEIAQKKMKKKKELAKKTSASVPCKTVDADNFVRRQDSMTEDFYTGYRTGADHEEVLIHLIEGGAKDEVEAVFVQIENYLKPYERELAASMLGLCEEGNLLLREVVAKTGVHRNTISLARKNMWRRVENLMEMHSIKPNKTRSMNRMIMSYA